MSNKKVVEAMPAVIVQVTCCHAVPIAWSAWYWALDGPVESRMEPPAAAARTQ